MILAPQQEKVFNYIIKHPNQTIREIRNATNVMKPCMRISEINYLWREMNKIPKSDKRQLIITSGRNQYRETLKTIALQ